MFCVNIHTVLDQRAKSWNSANSNPREIAKFTKNYSHKNIGAKTDYLASYWLRVEEWPPNGQWQECHLLACAATHWMASYWLPGKPPRRRELNGKGLVRFTGNKPNLYQPFRAFRLFVVMILQCSRCCIGASHRPFRGVSTAPGLHDASIPHRWVRWLKILRWMTLDKDYIWPIIM